MENYLKALGAWVKKEQRIKDQQIDIFKQNKKTRLNMYPKVLKDLQNIKVMLKVLFIN